MALATVVMLAGPVAIATGPDLVVTNPLDGGVLTSKNITVQGTASAPLKELSLDFFQLGPESVTGKWCQTEVLEFYPTKYFSDHFEGNALNTTNWEVVHDTGNMTVADSELVMENFRFNGPIGLLKSAHTVFPKGVDWISEFKFKFDNMPVYNGCGCGITKASLDPKLSTVAADAYFNVSTSYFITLYANGKEFEIRNQTWYHVIGLSYSKSSDRYTAIRDGEELTNFTTVAAPEIRTVIDLLSPSKVPSVRVIITSADALGLKPPDSTRASMRRMRPRIGLRPGLFTSPTTDTNWLLYSRTFTSTWGFTR